MPAHSGLTSPLSERKEPSNLVDVNSQLYAQGITKSALKLDGLSSKHRDNVIKIIQGLLQRRTEDLERTESVAAAHRVLVYDHDRLCAMHKKMKHRVIAAEKDKESTKAQMTDLTMRLQREQAAHKLARDEAQKAKHALSFVRTQAQHDAKKRDAQLDKTLQQWQKLANENARASSTALRGGMLLLNPVEPAQSVPRADSFWDPAINELNQQIISLQEECEAFRHVTLSIGNQLNNLLATANGEPEPNRLTSSEFFSTQAGFSSSQISTTTSHPLTADTRLRSLISSLKSRIEAEVTEKRETARLYQSELDLETLEGERVERVKQIMKARMQDVEAQLMTSRAAAKEAQELLLEYAAASGRPLPVLQHTIPEDGIEPSLPSSTIPVVEAISNESKMEFEAEKAAVEAERRRMTEGLVRLAQDRAVFETQRAAFLEERRAKELADLLTEPVSPSTSASPPSTSPTTNQPPKTPSRSVRSQDNDGPGTVNQSMAPTSAHRLQTPPRPSQHLKAIPSISSPLAGSSSGNNATSPAKPGASPGLRRRSRRGPTTPLARYVSHKIVAEKLASAKAKKLKAQLEQVNESEEDDSPKWAASSSGRDSLTTSVHQSVGGPKRPTALMASGRDNTLGRTQPPHSTTFKDRQPSLKLAPSTTPGLIKSLTENPPSAKPTPSARGYMVSTAASSQRDGVLRKVSGTDTNKLEVGQGSGLGPALAKRKSTVVR